MQREYLYEFIDQTGKKLLIEILSIFRVEGYDGKYSIAKIDGETDDDLLYFNVVNEDKLVLEPLEDIEIINIIDKMVETLLR